MDNDVLAKLNAAMSKSVNIDMSNFHNINTDDLVSQLRSIDYTNQSTINIIDEQRRFKEEREEENRTNLRATAESLERVNEKLEEQIQQKNDDLQNQRELIQLLKQQLTGISRTLSDLFILEEYSQELQEEANILAKEIYSLMIQGKKIDWKSIALDKGIDIIIAAIPIILQLAKVIN